MSMSLEEPLLWGSAVSVTLRMLSAAALLALLCIHQGHTQSCTEGFDYDRRARQCVDVDECRTQPDPCRGDMVCVNQNGGYLCMAPRHVHPVPPPGRALPARALPARALPARTLPSGALTGAGARALPPEPYRPEPTAGPIPVPAAGGGGPPPEAPRPTPTPRWGSRPRAPWSPATRGSGPTRLHPGYAVDDNGVCNDVDECRTQPDPCRGDMVCVNQNGGYLCMPRGMYTQSHRPAEPYRPEPYRPEPYRPEPYPQEPYRPPVPEPYRPEPYRPEPYRPDPYPYRPRAGAGPPPEAPPPYPDTSLGFPSQGPVEPSYPRVRPNAPCILGYAVDDNGVCNAV
ncbi:hypothetical protein CRUP_004576 [Coryphaenoides rupestris]|nr:hypothetical protein CRUP_004576 [Coryphaenoides rupestris]